MSRLLRRRKRDRLAADLEQVEPSPGRRRGETRIAGEAIDVDELARSEYRQPEQTEEVGQVGDGRQVSEIAFQIGGDVASTPYVARLIGVEPERFGETTVKDRAWNREHIPGGEVRTQLEYRCGAGRLEEPTKKTSTFDTHPLGQREGRKRDVAGTTCKRIRYGLHEQEVGGAGEQEPALRRVAVDLDLEEIEELRRALNLVDGHPLEALPQGLGVALGKLESFGPVQGDEHPVILSSELLSERGLACLPRTREHDDAHGGQGSAQLGGLKPGEEWWVICIHMVDYPPFSKGMSTWESVNKTTSST